MLLLALAGFGSIFGIVIGIAYWVDGR